MKGLPLRPVDIEPPIHKLFWKAGVALPPPILASIASNTLVIGTLFGISLSFVFTVIFSNSPSLLKFITASIMAGAPAGLGIALMMDTKRKKLGLPTWHEIQRNQ